MPIWTDNYLSQLAQDAIGQIAGDVQCVWAREALTITAGVSIVSLPSYVRTIRRVTWRGKSLDALNWEEMCIITPATVGGIIESSQSKPLYYSMHPTKIYDIRLYPTPNESFNPAGIDPYSPQVNAAACIVDYYREPDVTEATANISLPPYISRYIKKAYVLWKAFGAEGKGQNLRASSYYKMKYDLLIEQFRAINEGCFVGKRYDLGDGFLGTEEWKYPKPILPSNFERVYF
jgi:hypothetical protein